MTAVYQAIEKKLWVKDIERLKKKAGNKAAIEANIRHFSPCDIDSLAKREITLRGAVRRSHKREIWNNDIEWCLHGRAVLIRYY